MHNQLIQDIQNYHSSITELREQKDKIENSISYIRNYQYSSMMHNVYQNYATAQSCQVKNLQHIYKSIFGFPYQGIFVEVGAYDGEFVSNTSCLADSGWQGVYIEPIKSHYDLCALRHQFNNVQCFNYAIGSDEKEISMFQSGPLSTALPEQVKRYSEIDWSQHATFTETRCQQKRLDTVLEEAHISPNFDVLVIDVEGAEHQVIEGFNLTYWKPKMMIIELEDEHSSFQKFQYHVDEHAHIRKLITDSECREIYKDEINKIFLRDDIKYL